MSTTTVRICHQAGVIQAEAHDLCALGPALGANRVREGLGVLRLAIASLEGSLCEMERAPVIPEAVVPEHSTLGVCS